MAINKGWLYVPLWGLSCLGMLIGIITGIVAVVDHTGAAPTDFALGGVFALSMFLCIFCAIRWWGKARNADYYESEVRAPLKI